ncbi:MAG: hypothetical protein IKP21_07635 [Bacteroidales bacterium]|nr:hypothetical protein [Bacteroidales bacterium]
MKKVLFTLAAAMVMFAMTACNNNKAAEEPAAEECTAAVEQCEHKCMHEGDSAMCCKAEGAVEGAACEQKCEKAEGKECCKKAEGEKCCKGEAKECEKKCEKAQ